MLREKVSKKGYVGLELGLRYFSSRAKTHATIVQPLPRCLSANLSVIICVTDDVLHVRLQTLGVTEHSFDIDFGGGRYNWLLYDVGGAVRILLLPSDEFEAR